MRKLISAASGVLLLAAMFSPAIALATDPRPPPPPCIGEPICIAADADGNLWVCGPTGTCIPWTTSQPPLEP